jgi:hypothetical protein
MRTIAILIGAMTLGGCATVKPLESATVECEVSNAGSELRNCVLVSQTIENSTFGAFAVEETKKGRYVPKSPAEGERKVQFTVRGRSGD